MGKHGEFWLGRKHRFESIRKISESKSKDGISTWKNRIFMDGKIVDCDIIHYSTLENVNVECNRCKNLVFTKRVRRNRHISKIFLCRKCAHIGLQTWNTGLGGTNHPGILKIGISSKKMWTPERRNQHRMYMESNGLWTPISAKTAWQGYKQLCWYCTNQNDLKNLNNHNMVSHTKGGSGYTLDHKFSVFEGFKNNIPPEIIGSIANLHYITCSENSSKHTKCSITKEELYERYDRLLKEGDHNSDPK